MTGAEAAPTLHRGWRPGLIGDMVRAQALYYAQAWDFGAAFEATIAQGMAQFFARYDARRDVTLSLTRDGTFLGACTIDGSDPELPGGQAHLRWFIVAQEARGTGLGRALLQGALGFADGAGHAAVYLDTFEGLGAARRLYEESGFALVHEAQAATWGRPVREQRFLRRRPG